MLSYLVVLLASGLSLACGFAGLGLALYGPGQALAAATLFGAVGFATGLGCAVLQSVFVGRPAPQAPSLPAPELAAMVRATLASAALERLARPGSAADRKPAPTATPATAPDASPIHPAPAVALAVLPSRPPPRSAGRDTSPRDTTPRDTTPAEQPRFASSAFGA